MLPLSHASQPNPMAFPLEVYTIPLHTASLPHADWFMHRVPCADTSHQELIRDGSCQKRCLLIVNDDSEWAMGHRGSTLADCRVKYLGCQQSRVVADWWVRRAMQIIADDDRDFLASIRPKSRSSGNIADEFNQRPAPGQTITRWDILKLPGHGLQCLRLLHLRVHTMRLSSLSLRR